jgi:hypothetical protein
MIDLILQGTKANIAALLKARGLLDFDADKNPVPVPGCELAWWGGDGKFMTAAPVLDKDGNVTTPATFLAGYVVNCRIHSNKYADDMIGEAKAAPLGGEPAVVKDATVVKGEQWARSRVAKWVKDNGTLGSIGGIPCYTVNNVKLFRAADVQGWLDSKGLPGSEWFGGNQI